MRMLTYSVGLIVTLTASSIVAGACALLLAMLAAMNGHQVLVGVFALAMLVACVSGWELIR